MRVNDRPRGVSAELAQYMRSEYGAAGGYLRALVDGARRSRPARTGGAVRRFLAAVAESLARGQPNPGGA